MSTNDYGTVYLVGAGPGDPDLLTVKADRLIREADAILHDSLVGDRILEQFPASADVVDVGKRPDEGRRWRQEEINECLVEKAREYSTVVRLKGGDPMVFGRGGEEAEHLAAEGVPFEIVPGVTSPISGPELAGIPLTHRDHSSSLTVITGHEDPTKEESALDWGALADTINAGGTLVILMGVSRLEQNASALLERGVPGETPVAIVEKAGWPEGSTTVATLDTVVERSQEADIEPPAVIVVGEVVSVRDDIEGLLTDALPRVGARTDDERRQSGETSPDPETDGGTSAVRGESTGDAPGWRAELDDLDAALLDGYQSGFPVEERPFRTIAGELGTDEADVVARAKRLHDEGFFRRVGPVLNPPVIGSSTLAAMAVPDDRFAEVAEVVNGYDEVNHNYRRENEWNMWFVATARSRAERENFLAEIEDRTGLDVLALPMATQYYIDLEFPVVNDDRLAREDWEADRTVEPTRIDDAAADLSELEARLLLEIQDGFPLSATPYRDVADAIDASVEDVLDAIDRLRDRNCIKRIGGVVNHHKVGFDENCMVVWNVPADEVDEAGVAAGRNASVTYCCHRPGDDWEYELFTMIHGRSQAAVDETIDDLAANGLPDDHQRLYTTESLKQTGVRYPELLDVEPDRAVDADQPGE